MSSDFIIEPPDGKETDFGTAAKPFRDMFSEGNIKNPDGSTKYHYTNPNPSVITVGGIESGTTFDDVSLESFANALLYPELFPTLMNPSSTFTLTQAGFQEIGNLLSLSFSSGFNRGTISPEYGTSGFRSGLPNAYLYTGSGLPASEAKTALTDSQAVLNYEVISGAQSWTGRVSYDQGEQPKSSKGNDYDTPLPAGNTNNITRTITGVYPAFSTTSAIGTLTKQTLVSMTSTFIQVSMVAESGSDKQTLDLPAAWSAITGIQFYNTVSSVWEWIGGDKAASLTTFTSTPITRTIHGNTVNYNQFVHNGSLIGARLLRFYTI